MLVRHSIPPLTLGPALDIPSKACPGYAVRIHDDVRRVVVFIGFSDEDGFDAKGTGFFIQCNDYVFIATAKHVALKIGDSPFDFRYTRTDSTTGVSHVDPVEGHRWYFHDDETVDVAVFPITVSLGIEHVSYVPSSMFISDEFISKWNFGVGEPTYTVGLFRVFQLPDKNVPIVHFGNISLMLGDARIPVKDWDAGHGRRYIDGYLVQQISLEGLSGAPVFTRLHWDIGFESGTRVRAVKHEIHFLGLWHGGWEGTPDPVMGHGTGLRVPVGMGIVVPAQKIMEILMMPQLLALQEEEKREQEEETLPAADSAFPEADAAAGDELLRRMLNTPPKTKE